MLTDYYKILGIERNCSKQDIKKQFRKLASIHHPDKHDGSMQQEEKFKLILTAYETLYNDENRKAYDLKYAFYYDLIKQKTPSYATNSKPDGANPNSSSYGKPSKGVFSVGYFSHKYVFWLIIALILIILFMNQKGNENSLEPSYRPATGDLEFNQN